MEDEETGELFIPCRECSHKCFRRHGKYHEKQCFNGSSSFFKVLLGDFTEKLCVPPAFASEIINEKDKHMVLQSPDGQEWKVELTNINGKLEFRDGWKRFVHYHSLQMGDFVVFYYTARLYMEVHMFGRSGCAKSTSVVDLEKPNIGSNKRSPSNKMCSLNETPRRTMSVDSVSDEERNHEPEAVVDKQKRKRKSSFRGHSSQNPGHCFSSLKEAPMESAASFKSDKPFCRVVIRSWNVNRNLMFTKSLIRDNLFQLPNQKSEVLLLNGECKEWKINCVMKYDNPTFSGGWRNFTHDNNVKEGDTCVFEQLNNNRNKFMFKVHIFPETPGKTLLIDLVSDEESNRESEAVVDNHRRKMKSSFLGYASQNPGHCFSSQKDVPMESAASFKSDKPFCRMVIRSWNVYPMFTKRIIQDNPIRLPKETSEVLLLNGEWKEWKIKCIMRGINPTFCRGWRCFMHANNVKEGDTCVFEQLNNTENKFIFKVHIFPKAPDKTFSIDLVSDEENNQESEALAKIQKRKRKSSFLGHTSQNPGHCFSSQKDLPMESANLNQKDPPMESAASFISDKPFCRMVMKPWNVNRQYYLIFNKKLIRDYPIQLPTQKCEVLLLNGECKVWKVKFIIKDMYPTFGGGWKLFTDDNNVKEGDTCIFEQMNNNENKFMYKVHVFSLKQEGEKLLDKK